MDDPPAPPASPSSNPHPSAYQIGGVPVEFPYNPYGTQLAFMGRVISTLERAWRQGRCHALLESPTGTGKSLSLLCSSLAWQRHHLRGPVPPPLPGPTPDPLLHGGGFISETQSSRSSDQLSVSTRAGAQRKSAVPVIYYASRTHSQISQVIREYRKTSYRVPMAVLASRKHYCTNKHVCVKENLDEECKLLLKDTGAGCTEFKNAHKVKLHSSLQKGGCHEVHDIEDLVKVGRTVKGCSYFAAQALAAEAQLIFCPYSYIINPIVRSAMDIDIKGSIVILDEAHNIEDMARDGGSVDVDEEVLYALQTELGQLCMFESVAMIYRPLYDMIQGIISWIGDRKNNLQKREFEHYSSCWTGNKAIGELQQAGITRQCFPILQECATKAIKSAKDAESDMHHLSGISSITLEGLFSSLSYFFSEDGSHAFDYQLALQRYVKRDGSNAKNGWTCSLNLWCLNPAIVFREIANLSLSVILTSGTLSPMGSFTSELGVQFEVCMEAPHVIDVQSQLWAAVISSGPGNCQLNASYKTADGYAFQDALGASLEEICKIVPGGALVFFPSYKLLEKLHVRWCQTGQWSRLNAQKPVFIEPRGNTEEFESALKGYYDTIHGNLEISRGRLKGQKQDPKNPSTLESPQNLVNRGAAFLAVCRGKVSEGIDFSDENARVVVIVGIPFPNKNDIHVMLKKKYNDTHRLSKGLLSGSEWYCHQAFRALNQAAGRCIRHKFDYGAVILLDERFKEERNIAYISKWLRKSIKKYDRFDESLEDLRTFFIDAEKRLNKKGVSTQLDILPISEANKENLPTTQKSRSERVIPQKRNQKQKKLDCHNEKKMIANNSMATAKANHLAKYSIPAKGGDAPLSHLSSECQTKEIKAGGEVNVKGLNGCKDYTDLESSFGGYSRCSETSFSASSGDSLDNCQDIENIDNGVRSASPIDNNKNGNSFSTVFQTIDQFPDCPSTVSSEREVQKDNCNHELDLSLNLSVNSHSQKRRKLTDAQLSSCAQMVCLSSSDAESFGQVDPISSRCISSTADLRAVSLLADKYSRCEHQKPTEETFTETNCGRLPFASNLTIKKELQICCSSCKCMLGLHENNFLVTCLLTSSSKDYLAHIIKNGPQNTFLSEYFSSTEQSNIPIVISDITSVDQHIVKRCSKNGFPQNDVWSEQDGCVFRVVSCAFCTLSVGSLGLQIIATNAMNVSLLNKVIFYADHLDIRREQTPKEEDILPVGKTVRDEGSNLFPTGKNAGILQSKDSTFSNTIKSKLRLPKSKQISSDDQRRP